MKLSVKKYLQEGDLKHTYSAFKNIIDDDNSLVDFNTNELSINLNNPLNIECQPSYDGTVNLIINDDINPPRVINSRFTKIEDNRYRIINRNQKEQTNLYKKGEIDLQTRLFRNISKIPKIYFVELNYFGQLKGGNYTFYIKYADGDYNKTDIICESGQISVFKGNLYDITSVSGTLQDERTDKSIKIRLDNIDQSFSKFYIYYTREYSDTSGFRLTETVMLLKPYNITGEFQELIINGFEQEELISQEELNIQYNYVNNVKTQTQVQNMLFFGNIENTIVDTKNLQNISLFFNVCLKRKEESIGWIDPENYQPENNNITSLEYYDPKNIYYNLGYWPEELYRMGVVYIMKDDSLSPVFNLRGCQLNKENNYSNYRKQVVYKNNDEVNYLERDSFLTGNGFEELDNSYGVFQNPSEKEFGPIQDYVHKTVQPWYYEIELPIELREELYKFGVKGFFFVRQKRIPLTLCQGFSVAVDNSSGIPMLYKNGEYFTESFLTSDCKLNDSFGSRIINTTTSSKNGSGLISVDACVHPILQSNLDGSKFVLQRVKKNGELRQNGRKYTVNFSKNAEDNVYSSQQCIFINSDVPYKYVNGYGFSTRAGSEYSAKEFAFFGKDVLEYKEDEKTSNAKVRGVYAPFIGVCGNIEDGDIYNIKIQNYSSNYNKDYFLIRANDNSSFYAISDRHSLDEMDKIDVYRGDCFTNTVSIRLNRNFVDPNYPIADTIVDPNTWKDHYGGYLSTPIDDKENEANINWAKINIADLNAVPLGMWINYKCLSSYNLGLRSEDTSYVDETALMGNPRAFYPLRDISVKSANKIDESWVLNDGYSATVGQKVNVISPNLPYIKDQFDNRIMFSNVQTDDDFKNSYRVFQGLSYKDIDRQYGAIIKLLPWSTGGEANILCVFEHGIGVVPVNQQALMSTTTGQSIHLYGSGVLQSRVSVVTPDFGSIWPESIVRTPIGVYGVDTHAKKIWRYSIANGFETISDMKIQKFLNDNIKLKESDKYPIIGLRNIKTHYNNYKGDVIFTFYNFTEDEEWSLCFNERMNKWITKYSWTPLYSENINNVFYTLDKKRAELLSYIYDNQNTNYGLRVTNNNWKLDGEDLLNVFETQLYLVGDKLITDFDIIINDVSSSYIKDGQEINIELDKNLFVLEKLNLNNIKLRWNKSDLEYKYGVRIPLYYKFNVTITPHINNIDAPSYNKIICVVVDSEYDSVAYNELLGNGFYVHGRSGIFDEIDYYDNDPDNQIKPTKWYNKQEPFEFEFVVNEPVGLHKIFDNLVIISNKVEPKSIEFEVIGDVYDFKKSGLLNSTKFKDDKVTVKYDPILNQKTLVKEQDCKNLEKVGRRLGNIHYKEDSWYLTIEPIKFKNSKNSEWSSTRIRDKFVKIRVKYTGEDLVVITALKTLYTLSSS